MKTTTKAALLLLSTCIFFSQASLAGWANRDSEPVRDPSVKGGKKKECPNAVLETRCSDLLDEAYDLIGALSMNEGVFLSPKKGKQDADGLQCKVSGAEIKLGQDKPLEASDALYQAIEKVMSLEGQGKMDDPNPGIQEALEAAKFCVDNP